MRRPASIAFTLTRAETLYSPQPMSPASARASLPPLMQLKTVVPSARALHVPWVTSHFATPLSKSSMNSVPSGVGTMMSPDPPVPAEPPPVPPPLEPACPVVSPALPPAPGVGFVALLEPQAITNKLQRNRRLRPVGVVIAPQVFGGPPCGSRPRQGRDFGLQRSEFTAFSGRRRSCRRSSGSPWSPWGVPCPRPAP